MYYRQVFGVKVLALKRADTVDDERMGFGRLDLVRVVQA